MNIHDPPRGAPLQAASEPSLGNMTYDEQMARRFAGGTFMTAYNQDLVELQQKMETNAMVNMVVKSDRDDTRQ